MKGNIDDSTEDKIKNAARLLFLQKGFAGTRTRDIAEAAGINLALLNYYFRSKKKLFHLIMMESIQLFMQSIKAIVNNEKTTLHEKIELLVNNYIELLSKQPDIPLFLLSELRAQPDVVIAKLGVKEVILQSHFIQQFLQVAGATEAPKINPLHFLMNLTSMTVFPFVASPMIKGVGSLSQEDFDALMQERKKLIPIWIKAMLKIS